MVDKAGRVLARLRQSLCEGVPWAGPATIEPKASGSPLQRRLLGWAQVGLPRQVDIMLFCMRRGDQPDSNAV